MVCYSFSLIVSADVRTASANVANKIDTAKMHETMDKWHQDAQKGISTGINTVKDVASKTTNKASELANKAKNKGKEGIAKIIMPAHPAPSQADDSNKGSSWWATLDWLSVPFSASKTSDDRAVLPPLPDRPPVYCYYDPTSTDKTAAEKNAESDLLLTWRRAWWSQGFSPIILGPSDSMRSNLYTEYQKMKVKGEADLPFDVMRWLAWDAMEGGLLVQSTLFPMGRDNTIIKHLRTARSQGMDDGLRSWDGLEDGIFVGDKLGVSTALRSLLTTDGEVDKSFTMLGKLSKASFAAPEKNRGVFAYYSDKVVQKNYAKIVKEDKSIDKAKLNQLVSAHLHTMWQNTFKGGLEVVQPNKEHFDVLYTPARELARGLQTCPENPVPESCPPSTPKCTPCKSEAFKLTETKAFHNGTDVFTIGVVPHPWTYASLRAMDDKWTAESINEEVERDDWIIKITENEFKDATDEHRILAFKEFVASEQPSVHSLWISAEREFPNDLTWYFGFALPAAPRKVSLEENAEKGQAESTILQASKKLIALPKSSDKSKLRAIMESWSLYDMEAWSFVRSMQARRQLVRQKFEDEQKKYSQGAGSENGRNALNKWSDKPEDAKEDGKKEGKKDEKKDSKKDEKKGTK